MNSLQVFIGNLVSTWEGWHNPDLQDSVSFMVTEAVESLEQVLRTKSYNRNHKTVDDPITNLKEELGDTVFMAYYAANILGFDMEEQVRKKLMEMDLREDLHHA